MAEDLDVAQHADASRLADLPMRDKDGEIRHEFVERISRAIAEADTATLRAVVAELHEADLGDLTWSDSFRFWASPRCGSV